MATKSISLPSHVRQISSNFTSSGGVYSGYAVFESTDGYAFKNATTSPSVPTGYYIEILKADGTTFKLNSLAWCSFALNATGQLYFNLKTDAGISSTYFNRPWTLSCVLEQTSRVLTVVENLQNCYASGLPSTVTDQTDLHITLTASVNYHFVAIPRITFDNTVIDADGNPRNYIEFELLQGDDTRATIHIDLSEWDLDYEVLCETLTINAAAVSSLHTVAVTQNCDYCTTNTPTHLNENSGTVNIIATPQNGYQFNTAPTITFYDNNGGTVYARTFTVLSSKLSANVTFNVSDIQNFANVDTIILRAVATPIQQQIVIRVNTETQNAVLTGLPQTVYSDSVLNLIATANSGYKFGTPQVLIMDANGHPYLLNFTLSDNDTVAQCTVNLGGYDLDEFSSVTITANATAITPYVEKYGTINVYKVTEQNLADFAAVRFKKEKDNPSDTSGYFQLIDLGDYVVSVKRFYCVISDVLAAYLKAGNYNTGIQVETPQNDNFIIDCGMVTIPSENQSIVDYQTEIKLFLPFVGFINVPSDYVGKTIALTYRVNIITGDCIAVLTCNGIDFDFVECTISNDVVYKTNKEDKFNGNAEFNLQVIKGLQPYIIVKYFTDENKQIYNADCLRVPLSTISGYFAASELTNFSSDTITSTELQILQNELQNGVEFLTV